MCKKVILFWIYTIYIIIGNLFTWALNIQFFFGKNYLPKVMVTTIIIYLNIKQIGIDDWHLISLSTKRVLKWNINALFEIFKTIAYCQY